MKKLFLTSSVNCVADQVAKEIGKKGLKLLFITTPVEVEEGNLQWFKNDRKSLVDAGFTVSDYTITDKTRDEIEQTIRNHDVIYVSGGNVFYLLQKIQQSKCADVIKIYVEQGKIYIGTSAGSIIAGPDIYPARRLGKVEKAPNLKGYKGLGLVDFVVLPHWGSEDHKKIYLDERLEHTYNTNNKIILLTDYQYISVEGDMYKIIDVKAS